MKEPNWKYPFLSMKNGESFFVPTLEPDSITKEVKKIAKQDEVKIRIKSVVYDNILGVRVWRIG
tara:strand:- start:796 stop:987 length:192 start_codon:yes stop_codon:yes gene_type:complete